jgi:glucose-6-phosphate 1-dehydrogenase
MVGVSYHDQSDDSLREMLREAINTHSRRTPSENGKWDELAEAITYYNADFADEDAYIGLAKKLNEIEKKWSTPANRIFYLSVAPQFIEPISENLNRAGISNNDKKAGWSSKNHSAGITRVPAL